MARVLVVEHIISVREKIILTLDSLGHEIITCDNILEGAEYFDKTQPDLVIVDEAVSEFKGFELCRSIKEHEKGFAVPVVMLLEDRADNVIDGVNAGADYYILKPIKEAHLIAMLKTSLNGSFFHKDDFELVRQGKIFNGRYKIEKLLGYGSHSVVFLAVDTTGDNRMVALKLMRSEFTNTPEAKSFLRIAGKIKDIDSPTLIKIYDFGEAEGRVFVAMEYAERGDVLLYIKRKNFPELKAVNMGLDILISIKLLKDSGIFHLDIKPQNILRVGKRFKLSDFGVAVCSDDTVSLDITDVWNADPYVSPEHLHAKKKVSSFSDVYSLGVTLYQAVTGDNPFDGGKPSITTSRHLNLQPPCPHEVNPGISKYFSECIMSMLIKDPDYRPAVEDLIKYFTQLKEYLDFYYNEAKEEELSKRPRSVTDTIDLTAEEAAAIKEAVESSARARDMLESMEPYASREKWRLFSVEGQAPGTVLRLRHMITAAAVIILVFGATAGIGYGVYSIFMQSRVPVNVQKGPLTVVCCHKCGFTYEKRFKDISKEKCLKCKSGVGYALRCKDCGQVFGQRQIPKGTNVAKKGLRKVHEYMYGCPKCKSLNTVPVLTGAESKKQRKSKKSNKKSNTQGVF
jgi:serine/threonine protein kinase/CheY-like chemotaxis protein